MTALKLEQFGGMLPAWDTSLLPAGQAAASTNAYVFSGGLEGWRQPKLLHTLNNSAAKFAYRIPTVTSGIANDTLTFRSNPNVGDTVTVGEMTYKFGTDMTVPYNVLIGATPNATAINFIAALTIDQGKNTNQGILYGDGTSPNLVVDQTGKCTVIGASNQAYVQATDSGTAFNTTIATESTSGVRLQWATTPTFTGGINSTFDPSITGASVWLEFLDPDTNVLRSPVVNDQFNRYYMASPSLPPKYNTYDRIVASKDPWLLGINPPGCAPLVSVNAGGNAATLGLNQQNSVNTFVSGQSVMLLPIIASQNMTLNDCQIMPATTDPTAEFVGVVYSDNNGVPNLFLGAGEVIVGCVAGTAITSQFSVPPQIMQGVRYWVGFGVSKDGIAFNLSDDNNNGNVVLEANTWTNGPPGVFTAGAHCPDVQMWADLTTADVLEARAYVYTWVSEYGEESAPSPATLVNGWSNGVWSIEMWSPPPEDMGVLRNLKTARLYRTVSGTSGQTVFYWVCDLDLAGNIITNVTTAQGVLHGTVVVTGPGTVQDTLGDDVVALNTQLPSTTWTPPPEGLEGLYNMPNGMMVGFRANEIWFCEPYRPHAWPAEYVQTVEFPIVGLGVSGNAVVAVTGGAPYIASGVNPANISLQKLPISAPAMANSRGAIINAGNAVYYPSQMGLMMVDINSQALVNTTEMWITREKWASLTPQKNLRAVLQNSCYFAFGSVIGTDNSVAQQGYTIELNAEDTKSFTIWPQPGGHRLGFGQLTAPNGFDIVNIMNDPWTGITLVLQNNAVYYYDFTDQAPTIVPYDWTTKIYQSKNKENFSAMRVFFSVPPNTPAQNATRNTAVASDPSWNTLQTGQYGILYVYGDGNLITVREIRSDGELLRINSGQKYERWQWRVKGRVAISNMQVATAVKELKSV